jgi:hypothetical protein
MLNVLTAGATEYFVSTTEKGANTDKFADVPVIFLLKVSVLLSDVSGVSIKLCSSFGHAEIGVV